MKEDIKVLEEYKEKMIKDERIHDDYRNMLTAIENLIKGYKELEEELEKNNEKIQKRVNFLVERRVKYCYTPKAEAREKIKKLTKEIDKLQKENVQLKIVSQNNFANAFIDSQYISKSKVREKIEEIDEILALEPVGNKLEELLTKRKTYIEILQEGDK